MFTSERQVTLFEVTPLKLPFKKWQIREGNRLYSKGAKQLSDTELLAHLVRDQNIAEALMRHFSSLEGMACASIDELKQISGIGSATAEVIVTALEFGRRALRKRDFDKVNSPQSVDDLLRDEMKMLSQEEMRILILDNQNHIKKIETVFWGTLDNITVHQREIFKSAIKASAKSIILVHNHPSGNAEPSAEDRHITKELVNAGKLIGISVIDHIIITDGRYYSFKEAFFLTPEFLFGKLSFKHLKFYHLYVGKFYNRCKYKGLVDEIAIFNVALKEGDIQAIMNQGLEKALGIAAVSPAGKLAQIWAKIKTH